MSDNDEAAPAHTGGQRSSHGIVRAIQLDAAGLERLLGPLEAEIMEAVWALTMPSGVPFSPPAWVTVGDVCHVLGPSQHYKTTQTVMNRLVEKGALQRQQGKRPQGYCARMSREELVRSATREALDGLVADFGDVALAQLVTAVRDISPERLALLERLMGEDERLTPNTTASSSTGSSVTKPD